MKEKRYTSGFEVPENYFEEFDARLQQKLEEEVFPKDSGFVVPDGYFENLEEKLIERLENPLQKVETSKSKTTYRKFLYPLVGVAAVIAVLLTLYPFNGQDTFSFEDVTPASISAYIQDDVLELDAQDVTDYLNDEDIEELFISYEEISAENLNDYLMNNLDDTTLLFE